MSTVSDAHPRTDPLTADRPRAAFDAADGDDGIHIASVTRIDRRDGPVLRVVVSWFEGDRWIERTVELPDR